jgi:DNA polymerase-3 subunit gamma/tau
MATNDLAYHRKYRPTTIKQYIGNEKLKQTAFAALKGDKRPQVILLSGDSGCGKAQPLDSQVLTTSGYKRMGDIQIGDEVFTHNGNRGLVSGIYPQGVRPVYRITLSDRTYIDVSDEHLNCVYLYNTRKKVREDYVLTTLDLIEKFKTSEYDLRVEIPSVEFEHKDVSMSPYKFGWQCDNVYEYIPDEYLYNSRDVRLELLRGLLEEEDKFVTCKDDGVEISITSDSLSRDFEFLVRSLGIMDTVIVKKAGYISVDGKRHSLGNLYKHFLKVPDNIDFQRLEVHLGERIISQRGFYRSIVSIDRIEDKECQCIMVDHEDHTYISDFFIPTHNTTFARLLAKEYLCEDRDEVTGACDMCASCQELDDYIQTGDTSMLSSVREVDIADQSGKRDIDVVLEEMLIPTFGWKVYIFDEVHMATNQAQNRMLKIAEEPPENVLMIFCTTDPDKLLETLRNRCQLTLRVKKPTVAELGGLLKRVCSTEGVDCDIKGVNFIANRAGLTIRKALTSLEQVVTERGDATYDSAISVFEEISDTLIVNFYKKLLGTPKYDRNGNVIRDKLGNPEVSRDVLGYVTLLSQIKSKVDLNTFVNNLIDFTKKGIFVINQVQVDGVSDGELSIYRSLFGDFTVEQMANLINTLVELASGKGDVEMNLLSLGYTGLVCASNSSNQQAGGVDSGLAAMFDEVEQEQKNGDFERAMRNKEAESKGVSLADDLVKSASLDDIESLFGNVEVSI